MQLDLIRASYDIRDIVPGLKGSAGAKYGICPIPQHRHSLTPTASFSVYWATIKGVRKQFWKCHGNCGLSGDVIDLAGYLWVNGYRKKDIEKRLEAADVLTGGRFEVNPPIAPPPTPALPQWLASDMLPPSSEVVKYALSRGITEDQIVEYKIGTPKDWMKGEPYKLYSPRLWMSIPVYHHEQLMGIKLRRIVPGGIRYLNISGSRKGLWGYNEAWLQEKSVLLMKGEICAMVARRFGFLAVAPSAGEGSDVRQIKDALALASVIVVGDNDKAGRESAERRAAFFGGTVRYPPEEYKDWDAFALAEMEEATRLTAKWIEEVSNG